MRALFIACQGHSPSELAFSLDFTQVPVDISVRPPLNALRSRAQFQNDNGYIADSIQRYSHNGDKMMAEAVTLRGDMATFGLFWIPIPRMVVISAQ